MMAIIDKYVSREIIKDFMMILAVVMAVYLAVDVFDNLHHFIKANLPLERVVAYYLLKLPLIVAQITPIGIFLAVLISLGLMNKNNEIIALLSGGVNIRRLLRPVIRIGLVSSLLLFFLAEVIVPISTSKANRIWQKEVKKKNVITLKQKDIWGRTPDSIYHITYFDPNNQTISGITLNYFDKHFRLTRRVDAAHGKFQRGQWVFYDLMEQVLDRRSGVYRVSFYEEQNERLDILPQDLKRVVKKSEEMNVRELYNYIQNVESEGYDATAYRVDFQAKFSMAMVCVILSIMGAGIALRRRLRENLSISIAYGLAAIFVYWVFNSFCLSLGYGGVIAPLIAAWIANVVFLCLSWFVLLSVE